ncbi:hypothetical protein HDU96_002365 [Phlyctochytrium bullatum]|nr:hypothetical protein HDU96_002365 [Phlyctochytrium bullatum]
MGQEVGERSKFIVSIAVPGFYLLSYVFCIASTVSNYWYRVVSSHISITFGFFQTLWCENNSCSVGTGNQVVCSGDYTNSFPTSKDACNYFIAARVMLIFSALIGFLGLICLFGYFLKKNTRLAPILATVTLGLVTTMTVFQFLSMCLGSAFQSRFTVFIQAPVQPTLSEGFVFCIVCWVTGLLASCAAVFLHFFSRV